MLSPWREENWTLRGVQEDFAVSGELGWAYVPSAVKAQSPGERTGDWIELEDRERVFQEADES